ncbi:diguanylate cyclase with GAF sensor [Cellvibrio sp. BR]|uniref:sensor domain-containing diguanylate cyclase n=1 Tax=Cellvibrio sp. BR TaxID=1134474 RepID=UPI0002600E12|nr:sensor domain-containing diguanylate cyclase [Cellvibrio sp. BR]EIK44588.1 diguanylate cyclase with GAF sensor [Cellvibrio sp. BR]
MSQTPVLSTSPFDPSLITREQLLAIIAIQTEIAKVGLDLGGVMALVVERAQQLVGGDGAVIELVEGENELVYCAASGIAAQQIGLRLQVTQSLSGLCIQTGMPQRCDDSDVDARVNRAACRSVNLRSMVVIPLKYRNNCIGVLKVVSAKPAAFGSADQTLLNMLSEVLGAEMFFAAKYAQDELFYRATHDEMTGVANRALFFDRLRNLLGQSRRDDCYLAVLIADMDNLKKINDTHGHTAGDAAICELAQRLKNMVRVTDTVARLGGDEFGLLLHPIESRTALERSVQRLLDEIAQPFLYKGISISLSTSIGYALAPDDGFDQDLLLEQADKAMYAVKRSISAPADK